MQNENFILDDLFFEADILIKEQKIGEATKTLLKILEKDPSYGRAFNHLGWIYETKYQDMAKAEEYYDLALKFAPDYPAVYYNYAVVLSTLKKYDKLTELLQRALMVPGINLATIYNEFAIMYENQGDYLKAIEKYRDYIRYLFDDASIDTGLKSIERCKRKQSIFNT